jgi:hypothetical protein
MKYLVIVILVLLSQSCEKRHYKYKLKGTYTDSKGVHAAIWYTDTFEVVNDTAFYYNSDSSKMIINPPFQIYATK